MTKNINMNWYKRAQTMEKYAFDWNRLFKRTIPIGVASFLLGLGLNPQSLQGQTPQQMRQTIQQVALQQNKANDLKKVENELNQALQSTSKQALPTTNINNVDALVTEANKLRGPERIRILTNLVETITTETDKLIDRQNYKQALLLAQKGFQLARSINSPQANIIQMTMNDIMAKADIQNAGNRLLEAVNTNPKDVASRRMLVLHYMTKTNEPGMAIQVATPELDPKMVQAVELANKSIEQMSEAEMNTLADWYGTQRTLVGLQQAKKYYTEIGKKHGDDVVGIKTKVKLQEIQKQIDKVAPPQVFKIQANLPWQPTIRVQKGQTVQIEANGHWSGGGASGPNDTADGDITKGKWFYLKGQIGDGPEFKIGSRLAFVANQDGQLKMMMHGEIGGLSDNSGFLSVAIHN